MAENVLTIEFRDKGTPRPTCVTPDPSSPAAPGKPQAIELDATKLSHAAEDIARLFREHAQAKTSADRLATSPRVGIGEAARRKAMNAEGDAGEVAQAASEAADALGEFRAVTISAVADIKRLRDERARQREAGTPPAAAAPAPRSAVEDIELDASKGPRFDPDAASPSRPIPPTASKDIELDASKGPRFDMSIVGNAKPVLIGPAADPAKGIELDSAKIAAAAAAEISKALGQEPKWVGHFADIADKVARQLITVQEATARIDKLVAGRREEVTDYLRERGEAKVGDDPAEVLKRKALEAAKGQGAAPIVEKVRRPVGVPIGGSREEIDAEMKGMEEDRKKHRAAEAAKWKQRQEDADKEKARRTAIFGQRTEAITAAGAAAIGGGGAVQKIGAAVQIGASGLLGSGVAAAAGGPVGIAAVGAAKAIDLLAEAAKAGREHLRALADRGRELDGYSGQLAVIGAVADIAKERAKRDEARANAPALAAAINADTKLEIALGKIRQPIERLEARILTALSNHIVPLLEKLASKLDNLDMMADIVEGIYAVVMGQKTAQEAFDEAVKAEEDRQNRRNAGDAGAQLREVFAGMGFEFVDPPRPAAAAPAGPVLGGNQPGNVLRGPADVAPIDFLPGGILIRRAAGF